MITIVKILTLTALTSFIIVPPIYSQTAEDYYSNANSLLESSDTNGAIKELSKALELNPNYTEAYILRGSLNLLLSDFNSALNDYNKLIDLNPKNGFYYGMRAIIKTSLKDYKGAMKDSNRAIEINPKIAIGYCSRGLIKVLLGDSRGAILDFNKSLELDSEYHDAYYGRAFSKFQLKDYKGAIKDFEKLEIMPLINPQSDPKKVDKRYMYLHKFYFSGVRMDQFYLFRGLAKYQLNFYRESLEDLNESIALNPNMALSYFGRGNANIALGKKDIGCLDLSKAGEMGYFEAYESIKQLCN